MVFSSLTFLIYFLPIVLVVYYVVPQKLKNTVLLIASILFYAYGEPKYIILFLISILFSYIFGILIDGAKSGKLKKLFLIFGILLHVGFLVYFKYIDFLIGNINLIFNLKIDLVNVALPIGISFYTFQIISYLVDVYKGKIKVQRNIIKYATFVAMFPQLIAGPIVRYEDIKKSLDKKEINLKNISNGIERFIIGLSKKVILANLLGTFCNVYLQSKEPTMIFSIFYSFACFMQIYFDFSGYSDMAIGLGKMLGFSYPENFDFPICSKSITEFWRRWHITLGMWFRDYIYIPLGGNRKGVIRHLINIFVVWALTGLWHGASNVFIVWGLYFGVILVLEKYVIKKVLDKIPSIFSHIYTIILVLISFVIFNSNTITDAFLVIKNMFGIGCDFINKESFYYISSNFILFLVSAVLCTDILKRVLKFKKIERIVNIIKPVIYFSLLIICISFITVESFNPFIYFRF